MYGITFNNKHSYHDFGFYVESKSIQSPSKKKIKVEVPGMNGYYDFSTIASAGEIVYNNREITVKFGIPSKSKSILYIQYSDILAWLLDVGKSKLIFDDIKDYYFNAEVESTNTLEEVIRFGKLEVKFIAEPFKTSIDNVGADIWDSFNFEEDIVQTNEFDVVTMSTVSIYNAGRAVTPIINSSTIMSIIISGKTYNLLTGDNNILGLKLSSGYNDITINGTGHIKILFKKVRI